MLLMSALFCVSDSFLGGLTVKKKDQEEFSGHQVPHPDYLESKSVNYGGTGLGLTLHRGYNAV